MAQAIDPDWPPNPATVREQIAWAYANFADVNATWEEGNGRDRRDRWRIRKSLYYRLITRQARINFQIPVLQSHGRNRVSAKTSALP